MMRLLSSALLATLLLLAPLAAAEETEEKPVEEGEQAWVDDCPPDHMCAYEERPDQPVSDDGETAEAPPGTTCMDGSTSEEYCHRDVQYFGGGEPYETGPVGEPASGSESNGDTTSVEDDAAQQKATKTVPAPGLALIALGLMGLALVIASSRSR